MMWSGNVEDVQEIEKSVYEPPVPDQRSIASIRRGVSQLSQDIDIDDAEGLQSVGAGSLGLNLLDHKLEIVGRDKLGEGSATVVRSFGRSRNGCEGE